MADIPARPDAPLEIAISDCLLGAQVRYDGGHKKSAWPQEALEGVFTFVGLCPEVSIGLGVPREPIRLEGEPDHPRVRSIKSRIEVTDELRAQAHRVAPAIAQTSGYIFMKSSPSCGLFRVKVYGESGIPVPTGRGVYANEVASLNAELPLEESGRLFDPVLRENFVTRTFVYAHWQRLLKSGLSAAKLIEFHSRYKFLLLAHSVSHYKRCGQMLSHLDAPLDKYADSYFSVLMTGLSRPATRGGHANVLARLQGYVKHRLSSSDRKELAHTIETYRCGSLPLMAPLTLLRHHLAHYAPRYALQQAYLEPHPVSAGLRASL